MAPPKRTFYFVSDACDVLGGENTALTFRLSFSNQSNIFLIGTRSNL